MASSLSFNFSGFGNETTSKIEFQGDASLPGEEIHLTSSPMQYSVGRAVYREPLRLWDATTRELADFTTHFSFVINSSDPLTPHGDGLAFFLTAYPSTLPAYSRGAFLGLFSNSSVDSSRVSTVAVEFDTFPNAWDPLADHVGIDIDSITSSATVQWNSSLKDGRRASAWASYDAATQSVYLSYERNPVFSGNSSLHFIVDLRDVLPEMVAIGFSASTGNLTETHSLLSWSFNSTLQPRRKQTKAGLEIGLGVGVGVLVAKKASSSNLKEAEDIDLDEIIDDEFERERGPKRFPYQELASAARNFSKEGKLGEGGFGSVYKGYLKDLKLDVAIKRVSRGSKQGRKEYVSEPLADDGVGRHHGLPGPECVTTGKASKESDVYSFGIVALEIACGRRPVEPMEEKGKVRLVEWVWELYGRGRVLEAADGKLDGEFDDKQMACLMVVGLWCAHPDCTMRPSIRQAINVLNFETPWPELLPKMPVPMYCTPAAAADVASFNHTQEKMSYHQSCMLTILVESLPSMTQKSSPCHVVTQMAFPPTAISRELVRYRFYINTRNDSGPPASISLFLFFFDPKQRAAMDSEEQPKPSISTKKTPSSSPVDHPPEPPAKATAPETSARAPADQIWTPEKPVPSAAIWSDVARSSDVDDLLLGEPLLFESSKSKPLIKLPVKSFTCAHLAQSKYIMPEAIMIKKVLLHDETTCCVKPKLQITLHVDAVAENINGESGSKYSILTKLFRERIVDFYNGHPQEDEIPEEATSI
ncbi:L-type lectin-domain containing receptor kinase [Musa troglodytarum]|uniref:non-specific serine/threonine protein kinase n=1 Tax=Musa troglodytarum TaxID=320322 RepID=A0A9E7KWA2_9LILI|nr:L-type lectin-domain containing receptor kinase [Musa troglodytarum]